MSSKKKRAQLLRERDRQHRRREELELQKNWERISTSTGGFAWTSAKQKPTPSFADRYASKFPGRFQSASPDHPKRPLPPTENIDRSPVVYEGQMLERELRAQAQAKFLKNRVGPIGNKMGPQYLNDSDLADFERGLLRRR